MFQLRQAGAGKLIAAMLFSAMVCSLIYGAIIGSFSGGVQWWAAPVKVSAGLLICAVICLPSLYIFSCLSGSQARLIEIFGLVTGLLMLMTILLIGFAPWHGCSRNPPNRSPGWARCIWFSGASPPASVSAFWRTASPHESTLRRGTQNRVVIFVLVVLQMTTALRPIVGKAETVAEGEEVLPQPLVGFHQNRGNVEENRTR